MRREPLLVTLLGLLCAITACRHGPAYDVASAGRSIVLTDLTIRGSPPPEEHAETVTGHVNTLLGRMERCYADHLQRRPELGGEHQLRLWVSARQVIRVTAEEPALEDEELALCIKQTLLAYRLPRGTPRGGVRVRFKLVFTPPPDGATLTCDDDGCELVACGQEDQPCCAGGLCEEGACTRARCQ